MDFHADINIIQGETWDVFKVIAFKFKLRFSFGFRVMYIRICLRCCLRKFVCLSVLKWIKFRKYMRVNGYLC